jgi:hypothetical protein
LLDEAHSLVTKAQLFNQVLDILESSCRVLGFGIGSCWAVMSVDRDSLVSMAQHTKWKVVIALDGHILRFLDVVDTLQDRKTMTHARNAHAFEVIVLQRYERLADDFVLCTY